MSLKAGRSGINNSLVDPVDGSLLGVSSVDQVNNLIKEVYADNGVLGAKNLVDVSKTEIGTAWNGASNSARARLVVPCMPSTKYIISASGTIGVDLIGVESSPSVPPSGITEITSLLPYELTTGASDNYITFGFNKTSIEQSDINALELMLRLATDTDSAYQPYAMTNKELTEKVDTVETGLLTSAIGTFEVNEIRKVGKVVTTSFNLTLDENVTRWSTVVFSIPEKYKAPLYFQIWGSADGPTWNPLQVSSNGKDVQSAKDITSGVSVRGSATWITP